MITYYSGRGGGGGWWSRRYAPSAVEHALAATVVEFNPEEVTGSSRSNNPLPRRKRILTLPADVDTGEQLSNLRLLSVQGRWLEWTDVMNSDLSCRRFILCIDVGELGFTQRLFLSLCISISLRRPYTFFSRSPLVFKTLFGPLPTPVQLRITFAAGPTNDNFQPALCVEGMLHYVTFSTAVALLSHKDAIPGDTTTFSEYSSVTSWIFGKS